ncbi:hypothetical protein TrLO_g13465 [Triparma laevis f. longispina]|uniref:Uncharacterized protein n=1 Tax=Triparma laevis f. longispina TaxID=1714387 RepID=A0A9W7E3L6_9STRA|nr:hypothetical protein TrLO_g13465 [Triparma laevis f. longispina]
MSLPPPPIWNDAASTFSTSNNPPLSLNSPSHPRTRTNSITQILNSIPILPVIQSFEDQPTPINTPPPSTGASRLHPPSSLELTYGTTAPPPGADAASGTGNLIPPHKTFGLTSRYSSKSSSSSTASPKNLTEIRSSNLTILTINLTPYTRQSQYLLLASGVFCFTLIYGFLQELVIVGIFDKKLSLFLAFTQFLGYTVLSLGVFLRQKIIDTKLSPCEILTIFLKRIPWLKFLQIAFLRTLDLSLTNISMQYVSYPTKTLMKSSRVIFTMIFGSFIMGKRHKRSDYLIVITMVLGLGIFIVAESRGKESDKNFEWIGILMLLCSLTCDGFVVNSNEMLMNNWDLGQDEFILALYVLAGVIMGGVAWGSGEMGEGVRFLGGGESMEGFRGGEGGEVYDSKTKIICLTLFCTFGYLGSSCAGAITKHFGALSMSITSTARKAVTLFLSFLIFPKECSGMHIVGMVTFVGALGVKGSKSRVRKYEKEKSGGKREEVERNL